MQLHRFVLPLAAIALASTASGQAWSDSFDTYASPSSLDGQGGWKGWDANNTTFTQVQSTFAKSMPNSIELNLGADTVHEYSKTTGVWNYVGHIYIPSGWDGDFSYMIMNEYSDGGPKEWGSWLQFRGQSADLVCSCGGSNPPVPLVYDQWVEIRHRIDLNNDFAEIYYDSQLIAAYTWTGGYTGNQNHPLPQIEAIDLYPDPATGSLPIYLDDLSLTEETGQVGTNYECPATVLNSSGNAATINATGSDVVGDNDVTLTATGMPTLPSTFGYFLNSMNQNAAGFIPPGSEGRLCVGPANIGRYNTSVFNASGTGEGSLMLDLANTPTPAGNVAIQPGETWYFTAWFRDSNPSPTSNFTDAVGITFQ